jgi:heme-degrading monooxygenase HmoA
MVRFQEVDDQVPFSQQLGESAGRIVFMNTFHVAPEDVDAFMAAWAADGEIMQKKPGYIRTQLHRGIGGSTTFVNIAEWESLEAMRNAVSSPEFQASLSRYPDSAVASPYIFTKVAVPGICPD